MTSVIRHTATALVRNISPTMPVISLQATLTPGLYVMAKTYRFFRGKDVEVLPEDFIAMMPEICRLHKQGHLQVTRPPAAYMQSTYYQDDQLNFGNGRFNLGINEMPEKGPTGPIDAYLYLQHFHDDPPVPSPDPLTCNLGTLKDDTIWIIDKGTGNTPVLDVDVRVRIAGQTYSLFKSFFYGSFIDIPFVIADWLLAGDLYYLDLKHFLDSQRVMTQVWEGPPVADRHVLCHEETTIDPQTVRLYVTADPDMRFDGRCSIFKVT